MVNIIYIIVSILSIFFYIGSVQFKKKNQILIVQILASICYAVVYLIKGAWSGFFIELTEQTKDIVVIEYENKKKKLPYYIMVIFILALIIISIVTYDGLNSLLPLLINILLFVSTFMKNPKYIRIVMVISGALWAVYNLSIGAYIIVVGNTLEIISAIIALIRYKDEKLED